MYSMVTKSKRKANHNNSKVDNTIQAELIHSPRTIRVLKSFIRGNKLVQLTEN